MSVISDLAFARIGFDKAKADLETAASELERALIESTRTKLGDEVLVNGERVMVVGVHVYFGTHRYSNNAHDVWPYIFYCSRIKSGAWGTRVQDSTKWEVIS